METHAKNLEDTAKALRKAYYRNWYRLHPGKNSEYKRRYWLRKASESMNISS
jgi:hypothetical protein